MPMHTDSDPVRVHHEYDSPVTLTTVSLPALTADGKVIRLVARGEARLNPKDTPDPAVGDSLSLARALVSLAALLYKINDITVSVTEGEVKI